MNNHQLKKYLFEENPLQISRILYLKYIFINFFNIQMLKYAIIESK